MPSGAGGILTWFLVAVVVLIFIWLLVTKFLPAMGIS